MRVELSKKNWAPKVKEELNKLLLDISSTEEKQYVVLDWDNTCVYMDTSEVFLMQQLEDLNFNVTPSEMKYILNKGIPKTGYHSSYKTKSGMPINIDMISEDIVKAYEFLFDNYINEKKLSLKQIHETEEYKEFVAKYYYNYVAVIKTFGAEIGYEWAKYSMANMKPSEINAVTSKGLKKHLNIPVKKISLTSSEALQSNTGVLSISLYEGYRINEEMIELVNKLREAGAEVYLCSASFQHIVEPAACSTEYGYNFKPENIFAMRFEEQNGKVLPQYLKDYPKTFENGKVTLIDNFIAPKFNGRAPIMVAGDSDGDVAMMLAYNDTQKVLIVNRLKGGKIGELSNEAKQGNNKFLLQGRDENTGKFVASHNTIAMENAGKEIVS